jgi:site-specific DNA-methyltransferase (adenine-specific)
MKDYGHADQLGLEDTWEQYQYGLGKIFQEVLRVMRPHATCWINIGDKYHKKELMPAWDVMSMVRSTGLKLRQTFIWHKTNATPYGAKQRQTQDHEYIFMLSKDDGYYWNKRAVMVPAKWERWGAQTIEKDYRGIKPIDMDSLEDRRAEGKPIRTVWTLPTKPYSGEHTAPFPVELARRCMELGCKPGGRVLDPFTGSGATAAACRVTGRRFTGIDLRPDYLEDAKARWMAGA